MEKIDRKALKAIVKEATLNMALKEGYVDENFVSRLFTSWRKNNPSAALNNPDKFKEYASENPKDSKFYYDYWVQNFPELAQQLKATFGPIFGEVQAEDQSGWAKDARQAFKDIKPLAPTGGAWIPNARKAGWSDEKIAHYRKIFNTYYAGRKQAPAQTQPAPTSPTQGNPEMDAKMKSPEAVTSPVTGLDVAKVNAPEMKAPTIDQTPSSDVLKQAYKMARGNERAAAQAQRKSDAEQRRNDMYAAADQRRADRRAAADQRRADRRAAADQRRANMRGTETPETQLAENMLRQKIRNMLKESICEWELSQGEKLKADNVRTELTDDDILVLAQAVVKIYGHGNMIDLDDKEGLCATVRDVMRQEHCDEFEALKYMSGALGGGWG